MDVLILSTFFKWHTDSCSGSQEPAREEIHGFFSYFCKSFVSIYI